MYIYVSLYGLQAVVQLIQQCLSTIKGPVNPVLVYFKSLDVPSRSSVCDGIPKK